MKLTWQTIRDIAAAARAVLLFGGGLYIAIYEVQFGPPPTDAKTLILAAGMMGLEGVLRSSGPGEK
jgi:hypothetical protein